MQRIIIFIALVLSSGCTVIHHKVKLPSDFVAKSQHFTVKKPGFSFSDTRYDTEIGEYSIQDVSSGFVSSSTRTVDTKKESSKLLHWLLFDEAWSTTYSKLETQSQRDYSFNLLRQSTKAVQVLCRIMSLSNSTQVTENGLITTKKTYTESEKRQKTFLACSFLHGKKEWRLTLDSVKYLSLAGRLRSENSEKDRYEIRVNHDKYSEMEKDGRMVKHETPPWLIGPSSLNFLQNKTIVAAVSFLKDWEFWLNNELSSEQKELFTAISYSLFLFSHMDSEWD